MIVVVALFDTAPYTNAATPRCFKNTRSCHMASTLSGPEGTTELVAFAKRIGLRPSWIQHPGRITEHFDLTVSRRAAAVAAGAREVTAEEMLNHDRAKVRAEASEVSR